MLIVVGILSSCNSKTETTEEEIAVTVSTVAVKAFNLSANASVLEDLDSVFFSIDLDHGVIFNADSLPKGTDVSKLIPVITFANTVSKAEIVMTAEDNSETTVDYLTNPTDTIDFTRNVVLNVTAYDEKTTGSYRLKVNVHNEVPDSMIWDKLAVTTLPSRHADPVNQKTVARGGHAISIIEESNGTFTLATSADLGAYDWEKQLISFPFSPNLSTLTATSEMLWMLDSYGYLYSSPDGISWSPTGEKWVSVVGPYMDAVLGIRDIDGTLMHCHYPASADIADTPMEADFPMSGRSALQDLDLKWASQPTVIFVGGKTLDGTFSEHTWAFDGTSWATIDDAPTPKIFGATLVKYVTYGYSPYAHDRKEYQSWILLGGELADGTPNRTMYFSNNNGVLWQQGSELMQLPDYFPALTQADGIVMDTSLDGNLAENWTRTASRNPGRWMKPAYTTDGYDITWECPYIYLLGGFADGKLSDTIWRGVLARLTFTPII